MKLEEKFNKKFFDKLFDDFVHANMRLDENLTREKAQKQAKHEIHSILDFIKQEIKELTDKMIGEEAEYFNKEFNNKAPVRCSDDISYGKNYKRQEIINIVKEYLK